MAPEVVSAMESREPDITVRADVWALGITTIELADGKPPFADMHPTRAMFNDRIVALKIQHYDEEHQVSIEEEYRTLRDYCDHPNLPEFYGVYKLSKPNGPDEIWFVMEVRKDSNKI